MAQHDPAPEMAECLKNINAMIVSDARDAALRRLAELERRSDAACYRGQIVDCYRQLARVDKAIHFLDDVIAPEQRDLAERAKVGFELVSQLIAKKMRPEAFRELINLDVLCRGEPGISLRLVESFTAIGEFGFAEQIVRASLTTGEDRKFGEIYAVRFQHMKDAAGAKIKLDTMLRASGGTPEYWLRLSHTAKGISGPESAIRACERALLSAGGEHIEARFRLTSLLSEKGRSGRALKELRLLAAQPGDRLSQPQRFIELALALGSLPLAVNFAGNWAAARPSDTKALLAWTELLVRTGNLAKAEEAVGSLLVHLDAGVAPDIPQFDSLLDIAQHLPEDVLRRVGKAAIAAFPSERRFRSAIDPDTFLAKFRVANHAVEQRAKSKSHLWLRQGLAMLSGRSALGGCFRERFLRSAQLPATRASKNS